MKTSISIITQSSISALGSFEDEIWASYLDNSSYIKKELIIDDVVNVAKLPEKIKDEIEFLRASDSKYKTLIRRI